MTEGGCESVITSLYPPLTRSRLPSFLRTIYLRVLDPRRTSDLPRLAVVYPRLTPKDWTYDIAHARTLIQKAGSHKYYLHHQD